MKKYIVIDDQGLTGYAIVEQTESFSSVSLHVKSSPLTGEGTKLFAYLKNGVYDLDLGIPASLGGGLQLKRIFAGGELDFFNPDLPCKVKFKIQAEENSDEPSNIQNSEETPPANNSPQLQPKADNTPACSPKTDSVQVDEAPASPQAVLSARLAKYIRVYAVFNEEYSNVIWFRIHDIKMLFSTDFSKKIFENLAVLDLLRKLSHYLIGFDHENKIYYAIPARYEIDPCPFSESDISASWIPVFGRDKTRGSFGYFVVSEYISDYNEIAI